MPATGFFAPPQTSRYALRRAVIDGDVESGSVMAGQSVKLRGKVVDSAGLVMPGAAVKVLQNDRVVAEGAAGPLRVGIFQSVGARILPGLLRRFKKEWPRVEVSVREEIDAADLLRLLEHGELDLTFADLPLPEGPFESEQVLRDPYVLLVQAGSELAERGTAPPLRELSGVPIVTWRHVGEHESYLRGRVPDLNIVFRSDDNGTLVGLVAEGLGVAVVPQLVVNPRNPAVVALPFGNRIPPRHLAIVSHRDRYRSSAAAAFAELARELGDDWMLRASESSSASAASTSRRPAR